MSCKRQYTCTIYDIVMHDNVCTVHIPDDIEDACTRNVVQ